MDYSSEDTSESKESMVVEMRAVLEIKTLPRTIFVQFEAIKNTTAPNGAVHTFAVNMTFQYWWLRSAWEELLVHASYWND